MTYWWCLLHQRVEDDDGCGHKDRLGPFETKAAAELALAKARERNVEWDQQDADYDNPRR